MAATLVKSNAMVPSWPLVEVATNGIFLWLSASMTCLPTNPLPPKTRTLLCEVLLLSDILDDSSDEH